MAGKSWSRPAGAIGLEAPGRVLVGRLAEVASSRSRNSRFGDLAFIKDLGSTGPKN
eukprot:CAMPEP_0179874110 /NCGR_PEP_ID=MMETSP0982-20121206/22665_1 /TAXON_ID=483367 /ORGANISM="non described non described, Strain CCMP 2436" /LENGTH=55 /DNA_ID=CAMNT_0021765787 /DNA_START=111 /DNA_END=278 /DNA_ORIENTATION=-